MTNRLAAETSPYLLQHAENPVDWHPWDEQALRLAKEQGKPIFLSIGYSACHWCHVMEHESFEDAEIAEQLNEHFISIKVDREERPDLDQIYMNAVQLMTGHGGWPMSVFLTPDLEPFYGGTYWPPRPMMGRPGFGQVLEAISNLWANRREEAVQQAGELAKHVRKAAAGGERSQLPPDLPRMALARLERSFDPDHGGFGTAPKFPHPMDIQLLLRHWRRDPRDMLLEMAEMTLDKMAAGGIYDHLGGGFARYSVDARWLVPHFEKMLYDNALLSGAYLDAYLATGQQRHRRVLCETLDYVLRDMTDAEGGFHSTEDADSEGEEGKFYVWTPDEVRQLLGEQAAERFCYVYDVTEPGNFEGRNILHLPKTIAQCAELKGWDHLEQELAQSRAVLLEARNGRVRPGKDDKVLVSWNGMMIDSMARAGAALQEPRYTQAAAQAAEFIRGQMRRDDRRLLHSWRRGQARLDAYLDDYACLTDALVSLYEATWHEPWIDWAGELADMMLAHFHDAEGGGFFYTADDHETLIARTKDLHDASVPSGNAMAATALLRLGRLCGRSDWLQAAEGTLEMAGSIMARSPMAGQLFIALDLWQGPFQEVILLGDDNGHQTPRVVAELQRRYAPNRVLAVRQGEAGQRSELLQPAFAGKSPADGSPAAYVCQELACQAPLIGAEAILQAESLR